MIRTFFKNPDKGLRLDQNARILTLSWILKKDKYLFQDRERGVLDFVLSYLDPDIREWLETNPVETKFFMHDWTLNDLAQKD